MTWRDRFRRGEDDPRDAGLTLVELIVAIGIFTVVIAVFMGGLVIMTQGTARTQAVREAGDEVRLAFQRMDKQVRYASAINRPGTGPSGATYVEFRTTAVAAGASASCTQWRYQPSTGLLEVRSWQDVTGAVPGTWHTIIDDVRNDATRPIFEFEKADGIRLHQELTVRLDVGPAQRTGAQSATTFVARNTSKDTLTNTDADSDGQSDTRVCVSTGGRP